jgi:hypothetical protein
MPIEPREFDQARERESHSTGKAIITYGIIEIMWNPVLFQRARFHYPHCVVPDRVRSESDFLLHCKWMRSVPLGNLHKKLQFKTDLRLRPCMEILWLSPPILVSP